YGRAAGRAPRMGRAFRLCSLEVTRGPHPELRLSFDQLPILCLLPSADRYADPLHKDIFDLCMMHHHWGPIPESAWHQAAEKYGAHVIHQGLLHALNRLIDDKDQACYVAENSLHIEAGQAKTIVDVLAPALLLAIR